MPSSDFDGTVDGTRWAVTVAGAKAANTADPLGAVKDVGYPNPSPIDSAELNNRFADHYLINRYLVDELPVVMEAWDGLAPDQDTLFAADMSPGASFQADIPARTYWLGGQLVEVEAAAVLWPEQIDSRIDWVIVEVDANANGTYDTIQGTASPPVPAANQYGVFQFSVAGGPAGATPTDIETIVFQPAERPSRLQTLRYRASGGNVSQIVDDTPNTSQFFSKLSGRLYLGGSVISGDFGYVFFPLPFPVGTIITEIRVYSWKYSTSGLLGDEAEITGPPLVGEGITATLRTHSRLAPAPVELATGSNQSDALSDTINVITLTPTGGSYTVVNNIIPELSVQGQLTGAATTGIAFEAAEIDYILPPGGTQ